MPDNQVLVQQQTAPATDTESPAVTTLEAVLSLALSLCVFAAAWAVDKSHPGVMHNANAFYVVSAVALFSWPLVSVLALGRDIDQRRFLAWSIAPDIAVATALFVSYFPTF